VNAPATVVLILFHSFDRASRSKSNAKRPPERRDDAEEEDERAVAPLVTIARASTTASRRERHAGRRARRATSRARVAARSAL